MNYDLNVSLFKVEKHINSSICHLMSFKKEVRMKGRPIGDDLTKLNHNLPLIPLQDFRILKDVRYMIAYCESSLNSPDKSWVIIKQEGIDRYFVLLEMDMNKYLRRLYTSNVILGQVSSINPNSIQTTNEDIEKFCKKYDINEPYLLDMFNESSHKEFPLEAFIEILDEDIETSGILGMVQMVNQKIDESDAISVATVEVASMMYLAFEKNNSGKVIFEIDSEEDEIILSGVLGTSSSDSLFEEAQNGKLCDCLYIKEIGEDVYNNNDKTIFLYK